MHVIKQKKTISQADFEATPTDIASVELDTPPLTWTLRPVAMIPVERRALIDDPRESGAGDKLPGESPNG